MTTTAKAAVAGTAGQWQLTGIGYTESSCECCARRITQRVFQVQHPRHGIALLGRRCAAKATGYKPNAIERAAEAAARTLELDRRRAIVADSYPALAEAQTHRIAAMAQARADGFEGSYAGWTRESDLFSTAVTEDAWWGGRGYSAYATWAEYLDNCLARI